MTSGNGKSLAQCLGFYPVTLTLLPTRYLIRAVAQPFSNGARSHWHDVRVFIQLLAELSARTCNLAAVNWVPALWLGPSGSINSCWAKELMIQADVWAG